jgi:hypothetical protein
MPLGRNRGERHGFFREIGEASRIFTPPVGNASARRGRRRGLSRSGPLSGLVLLPFRRLGSITALWFPTAKLISVGQH